MSPSDPIDIDTPRGPARAHLLRPEGAALLLKTIEEPPPSTMFLILCDYVPNDLITISSRCVRIVVRSCSFSALHAVSCELLNWQPEKIAAQTQVGKRTFVVFRMIRLHSNQLIAQASRLCRSAS